MICLALSMEVDQGDNACILLWFCIEGNWNSFGHPLKGKKKKKETINNKNIHFLVFKKQ